MRDKFIYLSVRYIIPSFLLLFFSSTVFAQIVNVGTPFIKNYSRIDYQGSQQNWMIDEGPDGRLYFANNNGLLEFDGHNWNIYPIPYGVIRSILITDDNRIYVGGYNYFGYFEPNAKGSLTYYSLLDILPKENRDFEEIWRIHQTPDGLIFQSYEQLIFLKDDEAHVIEAPGIFHFSYFVNGQLILVDMKEGLLRYSMNNFFPLIGTEILTGVEIWSILPFDNNLMIATAEKGIFIYDGNNLTEWKNPSSDFLKQNQVYCARRINIDLMAFGTIQNGIIICTNDGRIVQKINRDNGLQNNTVLCMMDDMFGNLWLGTDNGIDFIEINSPLSIISYEYGISAGYASVLFDGILYLGTNQGVFYKEWDNFISDSGDKKFKIIESTRGQVWSLQEIDGQIFCGHNNGTFLIKDFTADKICDIPGCWTFIMPDSHSDKIIGGTYSGLVLFRKYGNDWKFVKKISGFDESSRVMEMDDKSCLWMTHGLKGAYRIFLNHDLDSIINVNFYDNTKGFVSSFGINVSKVKGTNVFTSPEGIYKYNSTANLFEENKSLSNLFNLQHFNILTEDNTGNVWYFTGEEAGVLRVQEDGSYVNISLPFKQIQGSFIGGFEHINPIDEEHVLIGAENGFIHYNPSQFKDYKKPFNTYIDRVSVFKPDSVIFSGHRSAQENLYPSIRFRKNALYFGFSANDFENPEKTEFSSYLDGFDSDWTLWETRNNREFTNLREGDYTFYVKARNIYGVESDPAIFTFTITPPWARSIGAYIVYIIIGLVIIGFIILLIRKKIERSNLKEKELQQEQFREREEKLQRETLEAEKEIIRLRNEKLKEQMTMKDKELANSTLDMIQKNKLLTKIKNDLKKISSATIDEQLKSNIHILSKKINRELDTEKQWEIFETHFENVHEAFLKRLKEQYPELSPRELKLCAYLRLNISSKEIAILMNISTRGVEISRYRLRKKLDLNRNENLTDFILTF